MKERHGAAAVLLHQGRVLLVRRLNPPDAGLWGYPGGHVEPGEAPAATAIRELAEETGVTARAVGLLTTLHVGADQGLPFRLDMILCAYLSGAPAPADDVTEAEWIPFDRVPTLRSSRDVDTVLALARGA